MKGAWREPAPDEFEAGERAWAVVRAAFAEREPQARRRQRLRPVLALAAVLAVVAAVLSPPGEAVLDSVRRAIHVGGAKHARSAFSSVPGGGRLLVVARGGAWVVQADGSKRRLGSYEDAFWSPHGKYVAATRGHELFALNPDGSVRWTLSRRGHVRLASWNSPDGFRIAYLAGGGLHIVVGNGTHDHVIADAVPGVRPAWRPGPLYQLAFADGAGFRVVAADRNALLWKRRLAETPTQLTWSADGRRLLVVARNLVRVYDARGRLVGEDDPSEGTVSAAAAFVGRSHTVAEIRVHGAQSDLFLLGNGKTLFHGVGRFSTAAWSPGGNWFLLAWPSADQLIFVRSAGRPKVVAYSRIAEIFGTFPQAVTWCCADER